MSSKQNEELARLYELSRQYRVEFVADVSQVDYPRSYERIVQTLLELGSKKFDSYAIEPQIEEQEPWKATAKALATLLAEKARRCARRNESSWRFACEPLIFARLSGDVVWYA